VSVKDIFVVKFGGSSLADAVQLKKVKKIICTDERRRYVIPSAPGKRFEGDTKVTDLLIELKNKFDAGEESDTVYARICERYVSIRDDLGITLKIEQNLKVIKKDVLAGASYDYVISRGEYLNGLIIADYLGYEFVDAADVVFFDEQGVLEFDKTKSVMRGRLKNTECAVIPGFYGSNADGEIITFSRGGSDITGSLVARATMANVYENWTDVSGFLMADPRVVESPKPIESITYRELRELSYMGASVLHEDAVFPVSKVRIPINIRNTNRPDDIGTMIVSRVDEDEKRIITGVAGKKNFTVIAIEKTKMNAEVGFGRKVLAALEKNGVSFEHMPSGIDTLSLVISDEQIDGKLKHVQDDIYKACKPDSIEVFSNMALIATVGRGMRRHVGTASCLFTALANAGVNIRMIDQGSSEINIIVGVANDDFEKAVQAIYKGFE
jgi:aspartate kinase